MSISLAEKKEEARHKIDRFVKRFEPSYKKLAYLAALPLALTPELLNYLRVHFLRGEVPWVVEVDLLLSDLCRQIGYELYAMDTAVRDCLLEEMREKEGGKQRMAKVAKLLLNYVRYLGKTNQFFNPKELQAQQLSAMLYIDEQREDAVRQLATEIKKALEKVDKTELARLSRFVRELAPQLKEYSNLIDYANAVSKFIKNSEPIYQQNTATQVLDIDLPDVNNISSDRNKQEISLSPGTAISHARDEGRRGTLGCFVRKKGGSEILLLSAGHVLVPKNSSNIGDSVVARIQTNSNVQEEIKEIATLSEFVLPQPNQDNYFDVALAALHNNLKINPTKLRGVGTLKGTLNHISHPTKVAIIGLFSTSWGNILSVDLRTKINYGRQIVLDNLIEIEEIESQRGDSGSLIVSEDGYAIGILLASSKRDNIYAMPIEEVLNHLDLELVLDPGEIYLDKSRVDYIRLTNLLKNGKWKEADEETARIMFKIADREQEKWLSPEDIENFPSQELLTINNLWIEHSENRFGFSVQQEIYQSLGGTKEYNQKITQQFWNETGLMIDNQAYWSAYDRLTFDLSAPRGHLPINYDIKTPEGIFGVIETLLSRDDLKSSQKHNQEDLSQINLQPLDVKVATITVGDESKEPQQLEFETITVDSTGETIHTETHGREYYEEALGENTPALMMMAIPGGEFMMGSPEDEPERYKDESPQHKVKVAPFWLAQTPITNAQWNFVTNLPQEKKELNAKEAEGKENHPVTEANWYDAIEFCARLSRYTRRNYRLPSEAEWEYACRAVHTFSNQELTIEEWNQKYNQPFHFGATITGKLANYDASNTYANEPKGEDRGKTIAVKSFSPNAFGLYDMHGQVWEWCADPWHESYNDAPNDSRVWDEENNNRYQNYLENLEELLQDKRSRVLRGGSWLTYPRNCRSACRLNGIPDDADSLNGFRVVVSGASTV